MKDGKLCIITIIVAISLTTILCDYASAEILEPQSAFVARSISRQEPVIVGNLPENLPAIYGTLMIKERTSDRLILEFELADQTTVDSAILSFTGYRDAGYSDLFIYAFQANGVVNTADYYRMDQFVGDVSTPTIDTIRRPYGDCSKATGKLLGPNLLCFTPKQLIAAKNERHAGHIRKTLSKE